MLEPTRFYDTLENRERSLVDPSEIAFVRDDHGNGISLLPASRFQKLKRELTVRDKQSGTIHTAKELESGVVIHSGHERVIPFDAAQHEEVDADPAKRAENDAAAAKKASDEKPAGKQK